MVAVNISKISTSHHIWSNNHLEILNYFFGIILTNSIIYNTEIHIRTYICRYLCTSVSYWVNTYSQNQIQFVAYSVRLLDAYIFNTFEQRDKMYYTYWMCIWIFVETLRSWCICSCIDPIFRARIQIHNMFIQSSFPFLYAFDVNCQMPYNEQQSWRKIEMESIHCSLKIGYTVLHCLPFLHFSLKDVR